jgi:hypothetical protein
MFYRLKEYSYGMSSATHWDTRLFVQREVRIRALPLRYSNKSFYTKTALWKCSFRSTILNILYKTMRKRERREEVELRITKWLRAAFEDYY